MDAITPAGMVDLDALVALMAAFHGAAGYPVREAQIRGLRGLLAEPRLGLVWLARAGGEAAGYCTAVFRHSIDHGGPVAEIDDLFVRPPHRGRGLGRALLSTALTGLEATGALAAEIRAEVAGDAERLYRSLGFVPEDYRVLTVALPPADARG